MDTKGIISKPGKSGTPMSAPNSIQLLLQNHKAAWSPFGASLDPRWFHQSHRALEKEKEER